MNSITIIVGIVLLAVFVVPVIWLNHQISWHFFGYNHNNFHFSCCFWCFFSHAGENYLVGNMAYVTPLLYPC